MSDDQTNPVPEPEPEPKPEPKSVVPSHDPLAAALGNASLVGVGYLMLGRLRLAVAATLVSAVLVAFLVWGSRSVWAEVVVLLWWLALVGHAWFLAGGRGQGAVQRDQRLIALAVTVPVLLAVGILRFDAARIERTVTEAREGGDCARALTALDRVSFGHRVADAPLTVRGERSAEACQRLRTAEEKLDTGLTGDTDGLKAGFDGLASVLVELPGHEKMVDTTLERFFGGLPTRDPCQTVAVTDWLRQRQPTNNALDRSAEAVARTAPAALVGCADNLMAASNWEAARTRYQQLLDQYPGQELNARAVEGVKRAGLAIELANVRRLLEGPTSTRPEYCTKPAPYSAAAPYTRGRTNRALFYGDEEYTRKLPAAWRATDVTTAVLVVCVSQKEYGTTVRTCPYENKISSRFPTYVAFRKIAIPVQAYELRTGKLVVNAKVEISGSSCPRVLTYTRYTGLIDIGPPSEVYVTASDANVRSAFRSLISRG
ncbi:tol-pal system YbgF family protein [Plantactinospora sp. BC1]|uniref:tetratricopeptide repeat protein n=1 Tax=Plantactinospora sp. BC1 TaxID=2108470 RepID=UPI0018FE07D1|nr:hypothetical protein [Plantactinospora sp. BC1]